MERIRDEIRIEAPVEHVWAILCDTTRWHVWMPRADISNLTGPYDNVGTTYVQTYRIMGFEMKQTSTVVEVEPLRLIHEHTDEGPMDTFIRFEPEGVATRVIMEAEYELPGHLPAIIKNLWTKTFFERQTRHILGDFKALAEATVPVTV